VDPIVFSILDFFLSSHDPRFVILAAVVCLVSAYACVSLLHHARRTDGRLGTIWIGIAALAVGFGIWATHFVAVLAFRPGFSLNYDVVLTGASLIIAIGVCGAGIAMAARGSGPRDHFLGGAVVGVAISSMHYTGIAALVMGGSIGWNSTGVGLSILIGIVMAGLSFVVSVRGRRVEGALLLTLAICVMHFTGMASADFSKCFPLSAAGELDSGWLSIGVAMVSFLILGVTFASAVLDEADRRRTERELQRQQADANRISEVTALLEMATTHMAQGLMLFDSAGFLRFYNSRLDAIVGDGTDRGDLTGQHFSALSAGLRPRVANLSEADRHQYDARISELLLKLSRGEGSDYMRTLNNGRIVRFVHSPIANGGWVTTVDDVTAAQRSQAAISHLAYHDSLTNILNRAAFNEKLDTALEDAESSDFNIAVIAVDLDRFKEINDNYGHVVGDQVLKSLATRLSTGLKEGETVARLGGDEFAAIKTFTSMDALREFLARIEHALFARIETDSVSVTTGASIGVAIFPEDGADRSRLLNNADLAMYRAKAEFDTRVCYYEHDMDEHARQRRAMAKDIWAALEHDAFYLVYQVQKSVLTNEITGYEVLLRWDRPGFGAVSPADFVPVAEECGAIAAIGNWVLKMACLDAASWPEPYKIAVNISGVQLSQVELIDTVRAALVRSGLAPSRLELEVTETSIIADKKRALHILRQIKAMGVSIAIDDFGTGYSSLDTLRSFPFDKIKLDRSFMTEVEVNEQSKAIVRAILALGRSLSVPVLAEGVETSAQLDVLRVEGCNEAQGFLLGRPGAIDWNDELEPRLLA
jgi:diguanylate cyclase (GGDEF)-like protein